MKTIKKAVTGDGDLYLGDRLYGRVADFKNTPLRAIDQLITAVQETCAQACADRAASHAKTIKHLEGKSLGTADLEIRKREAEKCATAILEL